jgi:hypothetical protein
LHYQNTGSVFLLAAISVDSRLLSRFAIRALFFSLQLSLNILPLLWRLPVINTVMPAMLGIRDKSTVADFAAITLCA